MDSQPRLDAHVEVHPGVVALRLGIAIISKVFAFGDAIKRAFPWASVPKHQDAPRPAPFASPSPRAPRPTEGELPSLRVG